MGHSRFYIIFNRYFLPHFNSQMLYYSPNILPFNRKGQQEETINSMNKIMLRSNISMWYQWWSSSLTRLNIESRRWTFNPYRFFMRKFSIWSYRIERRSKWTCPHIWWKSKCRYLQHSEDIKTKIIVHLTFNWQIALCGNDYTSHHH